MQTCRQCKKLVRSDHVWEMLRESEWVGTLAKDVGFELTEDLAVIDTEKVLRWVRKRGERLAPGLAVVRNPDVTLSWLAEYHQSQPERPLSVIEFMQGHIGNSMLADAVSELRWRSDRAALVQPDVRNLHRRVAVRRQQGVPATRDGAGNLRQLQERV